MKISFTNIHLCACLSLLAAFLIADVAKAGIVYSTDYSDPSFVDGNLNGQDGWTGQNIAQVDTANNKITQTGSTFGRNLHSSSATGGAGFLVGDSMTITFDYQYIMDGDTNRDLAQVGFGTPVTNNAPAFTTGFGLRHREFDVNGTPNDGNLQISPNGAFGSGLHTPIDGQNIGIDYGDPNTDTDDDLMSDRLRITWSITNAGGGIWNLDVFQLENLDTMSVFGYTGNTSTIAFSDNDAQLFQQLERSPVTAMSEGVTFEYFTTAVPEPSTITMFGVAVLGLLRRRRFR